MANRKTSVDDYVEKLEIGYSRAIQQEKIRNLKSNRYQKTLFSFTVVYLAIALMASIVFTLLDKNGSFVLDEGSKSTEGAEVELLKKRIATLESDISKYDDGDKLDINIDSRISSLESGQKALSDTILYDADKAITSKLLRESQASLNANVERLEEQSKKTNDKVDNFITTLVAAPVVGLIGTIFITLTTYIVTNIRNKKDKENTDNGLS